MWRRLGGRRARRPRNLSPWCTCSLVTIRRTRRDEQSGPTRSSSVRGSMSGLRRIVERSDTKQSPSISNRLRVIRIVTCRIRKQSRFAIRFVVNSRAASGVSLEQVYGWSFTVSPTRRPRIPPEIGGPALMHPLISQHQITPKTSRYTRCSMSMLPNVSINGRIRSSGQLGRWWYSISPCRNNECVRRFTVFAFNQRSY